MDMGVAKRVVSVGAHSLDAELMGGPLILKYAKAGSHCTLVHVTQGRLEDSHATEEAKTAYLKALLDQNQRAARVLGGDTIWLGYVSSICLLWRNLQQSWPDILQRRRWSWLLPTGEDL